MRRARLATTILAILCATGCRAGPLPERVSETETENAVALLPLNLAGSFFASTALHESGHALAYTAAGADRVSVDVVPGRHSLGETVVHFPGDLPSQDTTTAIRVAGPTAALASQILFRETLKTGHFPNVFQPSVQWLAVACKANFYLECCLGLARVRQADLGAVPVAIPAGMLTAGLLYDLLDLIYCDSVSRYLGVLIGHSFYEVRSENAPFFFLGPNGSFNLGVPF